MSIALAIPADLEQAFRQFSRDFARVSARWVEQDEETPETIAEAIEASFDGQRQTIRELLGPPESPKLARRPPRAKRKSA